MQFNLFSIFRIVCCCLNFQYRRQLPFPFLFLSLFIVLQSMDVNPFISQKKRRKNVHNVNRICYLFSLSFYLACMAHTARTWTTTTHESKEWEIRGGSGGSLKEEFSRSFITHNGEAFPKTIPHSLTCKSLANVTLLLFLYFLCVETCVFRFISFNISPFTLLPGISD